jgi:hypothetical protein
VEKVGKLSVRLRERVGEGLKRYNVYTESRHVNVARVLAGLASDEMANNATKELAGKRQGVMLFYPVAAESESRQTPTMGFAMFFPNNAIRRRIQYGVVDQTHEDSITIART